MDQASASALCNQRVTPLPGNHFEIVKPADREAESYKALAVALRKVVLQPVNLPKHRPNKIPVAGATPSANVNATPALTARQFDEAVELLKSGNVKESGRKLQGIQANLAGQEKLLGDSLLSYNKGELGHAVENAKRLLASSQTPDRLQTAAHFVLELSFFDAGEFDDAIKEADRVLKGGWKNATVYYWRGFALRNQFDYVAAIQDLSLAHILDPSDPNILAIRGSSYNLSGDHDSAIQDLEEATKKFGDCGPAFPRFECARAYNNLANARVRSALGQPSSAKSAILEGVKTYSKAISYDPEFGVAYMNRADLQNMLGNYQKAVDDATRAIRLPLSDSDRRKAYEFRATAYRHLGRAADALRDKQELEHLPID